MGAIHNDLATWAGKARARGQDRIEIDVDTAIKISEELMTLHGKVERLERKLAWSKIIINGAY